MSDINGIHHVVGDDYRSGYKSLCGQTVFNHDMPITIDHALSCLEKGTYLQPCKKCMKKIIE